MNLPSLLLTLQIALLCLTTSVLARPQKASRRRGGNSEGLNNNNNNNNDNNNNNNNNNNNDNNNGGSRRSRPSGRRLRMLQKLFKKLTPDDMLQLARAKKDSDYGPGGYGYGYGGSLHGPVTGGGQYGTNRSPHTTLLNKVECPVSNTDMHMFACPSPDAWGRYECIDVRALCNDVIDCPNAEDENKTVCMFHKMHMNYFKVFTDAIFALTPSGAHNK